MTLSELLLTETGKEASFVFSLEKLKHRFHCGQYINQLERAELAASLGVTEIQVVL